MAQVWIFLGDGMLHLRLGVNGFLLHREQFHIFEEWNEVFLCSRMGDTFQTLQLHLARMHARLHLFLPGG